MPELGKSQRPACVVPSEWNIKALPPTTIKRPAPSLACYDIYGQSEDGLGEPAGRFGPLAFFATAVDTHQIYCCRWQILQVHFRQTANSHRHCLSRFIPARGQKFCTASPWQAKSHNNRTQFLVLSKFISIYPFPDPRAAPNWGPNLLTVI